MTRAIVVCIKDRCLRQLSKRIDVEVLEVIPGMYRRARCIYYYYLFLERRPPQARSLKGVCTLGNFPDYKNSNLKTYLLVGDK